MAVPDGVRSVKRPSNTVVVAYGKNKDRYAVKARVGCERVTGMKNPQPKNGPTIGHIVPANNKDGWKYVPNDGILRISDEEIDWKDWGNVQMCVSVSADLLDDLKQVYSADQAEQLYCMAILRACYPGVRDSKLRCRYLECCISEIYPEIALSKNTVCDLLDKVGKASLRMKKFMLNRMDKVEPSHHVILDATLKKNKSRINDFSEMSRKIEAGYEMISVMYAFDLELMEPVAMKVYPGNMVDARAFSDFVRDRNIKSGIIVADKGFPKASAEEELKKSPDLHYIIPLKSNDSLIERYGMLEFDSVVKGYEHVIGKKKWIGSGWLYSFRDTRRSSAEERAYVAGKQDEFDGDDYMKDRCAFGTIVFECDLDLDLDVVYKAYECRWMIELMFRMYKFILELDDTREHNDYSVVASEFVNFLATIITSRLFRKFDEAGLLNEMTYGDVMDVLRSAKKQKDENGKWTIVRVIEKKAKVLEKLGLAGRPIVVKNPVGRPRKSK